MEKEKGFATVAVIIILVVIVVTIGYKVYKNNKIYKNRNQTDIFCGGIAAIPCPRGSICKLDGTYPDASGYCLDIRE